MSVEIELDLPDDVAAFLQIQPSASEFITEVVRACMRREAEPHAEESP